MGRHNRFRREATSDQSPQEYLTYYSSPASACVKGRIRCSVSLQPIPNISLQQRRQGPQQVQIWARTSAEVSTLSEGSFRIHIPDEVSQSTANIFKGIKRAHQPSFGHTRTEAVFPGGQKDLLLKA
ncbi:MAG: hypothetical protein GY696_19725, partial [Gammaproteobacteria bacterium]|nr:hypothetical protein [Gammaproteobacteria bacterium]